MLVVAALVTAFHAGTLRGIDIGIEEAFKTRPIIVIPIPCPTPDQPQYGS